MVRLATRFGRKLAAFRSHEPLTDDQIRSVAPSIFAEGAHESRSQRYTYIPTSHVLQGLRAEGFQPFMVAQTRTRQEGKRDHTKHLVRLRHASQIVGAEANEIVMVNSHDGTSSYQMIAGMLRFVCTNGLICGESVSDLRIPHKGDVMHDVIHGAFEVLDGFTRVVEEREGMKAVELTSLEQTHFARAALELKHDTQLAPAPITETQLLQSRRFEDRGSDLWTTFNRVQENLVQGGLPSRTARGQRSRTRPVAGIDQGVKLNRALWVLAEAMRKHKA